MKPLAKFNTRRVVSHRVAKKRLKANLRKTKHHPKIKILKTIGKIYLIEPLGTGGNRNIICLRYWDYIAVVVNHPKLDEILSEAGSPLAPLPRS